MIDPEELEVAVRAWVVPDYRRRRPNSSGTGFVEDLGPSEWSITFDTETRVDASQRPRIGAFQVRRGPTLKRAGIFYDPGALSPAEVTEIRVHARMRGHRVLTLREFVDRVFYPVAWDLGGLVVGFNLPFDVSRLAIDHGPAKDRQWTMRGGFSFRLSTNEPRANLQVKRIGSRAAFVRFAIPKGRHAEQRNRERGGRLRNRRGYFVDVATIGAALLSHKGSLKKLGEILRTRHRKLDAPHGAEINGEYLRYAMRDVLLTWECFEILRARYEAYGLARTPIWRIYSEASVGKASKGDGGHAMAKAPADLPTLAHGGNP